MQSSKGPGDGAVPAWSARLIGTPNSHIYDLRHARNHAELAEHRETLEVLAALVEYGRFPLKTHGRNQGLGIAKASNQRVNKLIADVVAKKVPRNDRRASDPEIWRRFIEGASLC